MRRITEFEGLRAILAWWVVWSHLLPYSGIQIINLPIFAAWLFKAGYAVDVFIILSGFVIFLLLDSLPKKSYMQFITERFFRIFPLFLVVFVAAIILMPLKVFVFTNGQWHNIKFAAKMLQEAQNGYNYFAVHIISHLTIMHGIIPDNWIPNSSIAFLAPAWSISLEWQFYLIAPFLILLSRRSLVASFATCLITIIFGQLISRVLKFGYGAFLPIKFEFFVIGICSYYAYKYCEANSKAISKYFSAVSTGLIIISFLTIFIPYKPIAVKAIPLTIWLIPLASAIANSISIKFLPLNLVSNILNSTPLQQLGKVSYSTYLGHILIFWLLMWSLLKFIPNVNQSTVLTMLSSVGVITVIITSFAMYYWIEKPFIKYGKQFSQKMSESINP
ncbi:hypothetical protein NIES2100_16390 [Calothrix sp. NIES-2100]|uniref:acyltransferase family protein n=1 Tax=Calothrix sp. NIES-2100 TaxID=1954172 RepID=UPI000B5ECE05|nr:hypothetical protein NIES2100_16390 [Calothrix sp. NIES-2100]